VDGQKIVVPLVFGYIITRLGPRFIQGCILPPTSESHLGNGKTLPKKSTKVKKTPKNGHRVGGSRFKFSMYQIPLTDPQNLNSI
jgi:hypothetical protein